MKDIIITGKRIRTELVVLAACFGVAFLINVIAIISYVKPWHEVFTQIGFVIVITAVLYFVALLFRGLFWICKKLISK